MLLRADQRLKKNHKDVLLPVHPQELYLSVKRKSTDIEPEDYSPGAYPVSKQLSTLLRRGDLPREKDGAIEFWRLKDYLRNDFLHSQHWSDEMWKSTMAKRGGIKKRFQSCIDPSGQEILSLRALQGHPGRNHIDVSFFGQCIYSEQFLRVHLSYWMCSQFTLYHRCRIDSGRTKFLQGQPDFIVYSRESHAQESLRIRKSLI